MHEGIGKTTEEERVEKEACAEAIEIIAEEKAMAGKSEPAAAVESKTTAARESQEAPAKGKIIGVAVMKPAGSSHEELWASGLDRAKRDCGAVVRRCDFVAGNRSSAVMAKDPAEGTPDGVAGAARGESAVTSVAARGVPAETAMPAETTVSALTAAAGSSGVSVGATCNRRGDKKRNSEAGRGLHGGNSRY